MMIVFRDFNGRTEQTARSEIRVDFCVEIIEAAVSVSWAARGTSRLITGTDPTRDAAPAGRTERKMNRRREVSARGNGRGTVVISEAVCHSCHS